MKKVELSKFLSEPDPLGRILLPYRHAKAVGIRKGDIVQTDAGPLKVVAYVDWNPRAQRRVAAFACEEA